MPSLLIIAQESKTQARLQAILARNGFTCSITPYNEGITADVARQSPDLVLVEMDGKLPDSGTWGLIRELKQARPLPVMALIPEEMLDHLNGHLDMDDFLVSPYDDKELVLRTRRLLHRARNMENSEMIKCDGLMIDLARCEVTLEGKVVGLTFKEYELLKFLASNKGRVYSRDTLLNSVWGYDYYGGDRTVDVHIRRLRSKIEDTNHTLIETVRNIGYRFQKSA